MEWWTPPMQAMPYSVGSSPATFLLYWAIPAVVVALFVLQNNWEPLHQLQRHRRFMGHVDPHRSRELDREEQRLRFEAWRRAMLIVFGAAAVAFAGSSLSLGLALWLRSY